MGLDLHKSSNVSNELPAFYTDDITLLPYMAIWRVLRRQPIGFALFPYFLARKILKLRHSANHGNCRVTELPPVREDEIPPEAVVSMRPFHEVCKSQDMVHVRCTRSPSIGNKTVITSIWLDKAGAFYCNATWIYMQLGALRKAKTTFACHSYSVSGGELHTAPMAFEEWIPEIVPPGNDFIRLAADSTPSHVIETHRERIAIRTDLRKFNPDSLLEQIVRSSQEHFDYLVAKGVYAPLTHAETLRLKSQRPSVID